MLIFTKLNIFFKNGKESKIRIVPIILKNTLEPINTNGEIKSINSDAPKIGATYISLAKLLNINFTCLNL